MDKIKLLDALVEGTGMNLELLDNMHAKIDNELKNIVAEAVGLGNAMTFNDETGYPRFNDPADPCLVSVVGIRVNKAPTGYLYFQFNTDCGDGPDGLDENGWFQPSPEDYDLNDLYENIAYWIDKNCRKV